MNPCFFVVVFFYVLIFVGVPVSSYSVGDILKHNFFWNTRISKVERVGWKWISMNMEYFMFLRLGLYKGNF